MSERAAGILMQIGSKEQARVIGRFSRLDRPVMGILRISLFLHLQEIRTLSVWMN